MKSLAGRHRCHGAVRTAAAAAAVATVTHAAPAAADGKPDRR